jgi:hypothetical protein
MSPSIDGPAASDRSGYRRGLAPTGQRRILTAHSSSGWRNSCSEEAWRALPYIGSLIDKCHEKGVTVIYTTGVRREDNLDSSSWDWKNSRNEGIAALL